MICIIGTSSICFGWDHVESAQIPERSARSAPALSVGYGTGRRHDRTTPGALVSPFLACRSVTQPPPPLRQPLPARLAPASAWKLGFILFFCAPELPRNPSMLRQAPLSPRVKYKKLRFLCQTDNRTLAIFLTEHCSSGVEH
jgi:hypothetical protein